MVSSGPYPKEYESTWRDRIGALMPGGQDHWWKIYPSSDLQSLADEVADAVTQQAVPWLDAASDLRHLLELVKPSPRGEIAAAIALELGRPDQARAFVQSAIATAPQAEAYIRQFAVRNHVALD
jgi:hypothetical protein